MTDGQAGIPRPVPLRHARRVARNNTKKLKAGYDNEAIERGSEDEVMLHASITTMVLVQRRNEIESLNEDPKAIRTSNQGGSSASSLQVMLDMTAQCTPTR